MYVTTMKIILIFVLQFLGVLTQASKKDSELNLHFIQNDYQLKFERIELISYSKEYFTTFTIRTFKYNRTCAVLNVTALLKVDLMTDMEVIVQGYKFMSNEYRFFPVHFQVNACKAFAANVAGVGNAIKCGNFTGCPLLKGRTIHFCNWHPDASKLPPYMPSGSYMLELQGFYRLEEIWLTRAYAVISRPEV